MKTRIITLMIVLLVLLGAAGCGTGGNGSAADSGQGGASADSGQGGGSADSSQGGDAQAQNGGDTQGGVTQGGGSADSGQGGDAQGGAQSGDTGVVLQDLDGNSVSLSDYKGQIVVLNFWASWCPPCRNEMPELNELDKELKASGDAVFISVNLTDGQRETADTARKYVEDNDLGFTVLLDDKGQLANEYLISSIPQTFILDRDGAVSGSILGSTTKAAILAKVDAAK